MISFHCPLLSSLLFSSTLVCSPMSSLACVMKLLLGRPLFQFPLIFLSSTLDSMFLFLVLCPSKYSLLFSILFKSYLSASIFENLFIIPFPSSSLSAPCDNTSQKLPTFTNLSWFLSTLQDIQCYRPHESSDYFPQLNIYVSW